MAFEKNERNTVIYGTTYDTDNQDKSGIFEYDIKNDTHKIIKLWKTMNVYPGGYVTIYNKTEDKMIFVGGGDAQSNYKLYDYIMIYNMKNNKIINIDIKTVIGPNSVLALTNNDNYLHIIGGGQNYLHIIK